MTYLILEEKEASLNVNRVNKTGARAAESRLYSGRSMRDVCLPNTINVGVYVALRVSYTRRRCAERRWPASSSVDAGLSPYLLPYTTSLGGVRRHPSAAVDGRK